MADNVVTQSATLATPAAGINIATVEATFSGDTVQAGVGALAKVAGAEGARTLTLINPATEDKQDDIIAALASVPVTGGLTDAELRATPVPVSGTITANAGTNLNTSALALEAGGNLAAILAKIIAAPATEAKQDTGNTSLATIAGKDFATQTTLAAILAKIIAAPATEATLASILTALQIIDDWDESDRAKVNPIVGQAGVQGDAGVVTALTQRVAIATNANLVSLAANQSVNVAQINGVTPLMGAGNTGTGSHRVTIATDQLPVATTETAPTTIYNGKTTVSTAGTQVALGASQAIKSVTVKALIANTGLIYVGDSNVSSADGFQLSPGDSVSLAVANRATVFVDSAVNGEGVSYIAVN